MNKASRIGCVWLAGGAILLVGVAATQADFTGHTVTAQWRYPNFQRVIETHDVVVGDEVELPAAKIKRSSNFDIDIRGDTILFAFNRSSDWENPEFNGWWFHDTDGTIPEITGYTIDEVSSGISGLSNDALTFDKDSVWGNFTGVTVAGGGDFIRLKVSFVDSCDPCDTNCDGSIDAADVDSFVILLLGNDDPCGACTGDTNDDGSVDLTDVERFIECLLE